MIDTHDGLQFVDLGFCVVVQVGPQSLGITRQEFYELAEAGPKQRERLLTEWLKEAE